MVESSRARTNEKTSRGRGKPARENLKRRKQIAGPDQKLLTIKKTKLLRSRTSVVRNEQQKT
jgi:hypothetical protein